ncbi:thioredoxin-like protein [Coprinopsis marcescibilis]|uniref:Thioredoxin-like protein n=1 Tax=Coprinopsis marcescibilis TaxID=230819 RepID=A0A5C3L047_COPMA|nr:thioredoxin-like protein [Coprinopsis marcescibilis]
MSVNPNEDTEFNDALRKHGILPPREKTPPTPSPPGSPTFDDLLNDSTAAELERLGQRLKDDDEFRRLEAQRRRLLAEDRREQRDARFGQVIPISREDYTREVTEASNLNAEDDDNETGTGVVCFLYKDGVPRSDKAFPHIRALAAKFPRTKFVSIVGDKCVPNLPDVRIPMIIIYRKGEILNQIIAWGSDRDRTQGGEPSMPLLHAWSKLKCTLDLEAMLAVSGAIHPSEAIYVEESRQSESLSDDEEEDWDADASSRMRSAATSVNARAPKNIRGPARRNSDSDFEFDL